MPRKPVHRPLQVWLENRRLGLVRKEPDGAVSFEYDADWLERSEAVPLSVSLPLRREAYRGARVSAVLENVLPDSEALRALIATRVGAPGTDAHSLLSVIGRDCVGALRFVPDGEAVPQTRGIQGQALARRQIEALLKGLGRAPLGMEMDDDAFRISVAGAQEKTALLFHEGKWWKPHGSTPTTHILKAQIGSLPNGLDLSNSVENEFYCLKLLSAFGIPTAHAQIKTFGKATALVVERFDRRRTGAGELRRLHQEDFCQALSCPPGLKYQNQGGPGMVAALKLLQASDTPWADQKTFLKAQILFWLIGATDGHAKNFSIFLGPGGRFKLTPLYDVLSAQPSLDARRIERKQLKLAMSVGDSRHYRIDEIRGRHFVQTAKSAGLSAALADEALGEVAAGAEKALAQAERGLPKSFPAQIAESVARGLKRRLKGG